MQQAPDIIVQLIHIEGPLKGQIQEFSKPEIAIGRHPSCEVRFPADMKIVSRKHAQIIRVGNRFKLVDNSTNGTQVNGKPIKEIFLNDGDVLTIAQGGAKLSFLTRISEGAFKVEPQPPAEEPVPAAQAAPPKPSPLQTPAFPEAPSPPIIDNKQQKPIAEEPPSAPVKAPLTILLGPTLRTFDTLPVSFGKDPGCEFVVAAHGLLSRQALIFFANNQYRVKDLTGQDLVKINNVPVKSGMTLNHDDALELSPDGPRFRFLAGGRLVEIERPAVAPSEPPANKNQPEKAEKAEKSKSFFTRFFPNR